MPRDSARRSSGRADLGGNREADFRAAALDRLRARDGARRCRKTVSRAAGAGRLPAGARVAPRRRRVGAHAAGRRRGARARRRSSTSAADCDHARRHLSRFREAGDHRRARRADSLDGSRGTRRRAGAGVSRSAQRAVGRRLRCAPAGRRPGRPAPQTGHVVQGARRGGRRRVPASGAKGRPRAAGAAGDGRLPGPEPRRLRLLCDGLVPRPRAIAWRRASAAGADSARSPSARPGTRPRAPRG